VYWTGVLACVGAADQVPTQCSWSMSLVDGLAITVQAASPTRTYINLAECRRRLHVPFPLCPGTKFIGAPCMAGAR
jgi:hypothetical protein